MTPITEKTDPEYVPDYTISGPFSTWRSKLPNDEAIVMGFACLFALYLAAQIVRGLVF